MQKVDVLLSICIGVAAGIHSMSALSYSTEQAIKANSSIAIAGSLIDSKQNNMTKFENNTNILFVEPLELDNWVIVNDTVMGGRSMATITRMKNAMVFSGELSLENNGGFASTRRMYAPLAWKPNNAIQITVMGDGRSYQFRLRTNRNMDGLAYVAKFDSVANTQQTLTFKLSDFTASFRGRKVPNAPALSFEDVAQLGFMLADKTPGKFSLSVSEIKGVTP